MSDPVDDALNFLEQHAPGFLKGAVETLREGWDFVMDSFPDPGVIRTQGSNLSSLYDRGEKLLEQYAQSLQTLPSKWQGDLADTYLPPSGMAIALQHGVEVTDNSASTQLSGNFATVVDSLQHNSGTHYSWATQFDNVRGKQTEARVTIGGAAVVAAAALAVPVGGELFDGGELAAAAVDVGSILDGVRQIWQDYQIIIIVAAVAVTAVGVNDLIKAHLETTTGAGSTTYAYEAGGTVTGARGFPSKAPPKLSEGEIQDIAQRLAQEFAHLGITEEDIAAMLRLFGSEEVIRYFLKHAEATGAVWNNMGNIVALFQQFLHWSLDPTSGQYQWQEGVVAMYYIEVLGRPWERSENPAWDFTEGNTHWDVKSFWHTSTGDMVQSIQESIANGESVVIDTTNMTQQEIQDLANEIANRGWGNFVEWFPPN